jgi:hypothetical protein
VDRFGDNVSGVYLRQIPPLVDKAEPPIGWKW